MKSTYKTRAREVIIAYLNEHSEQRFTAKEVYESVAGRVNGINRTTVYRNLDRLCETGELLRFREPNQDSWYFQYSREHDNCDEHMHARCSICGRVFHLEKPFVSRFEKDLLEEYGLDLEPSQTVIIGKCSECRDK
ncbi:MAG: transcriptional repressor [Clostridia bacterium]|nr:transcriptional repressor [Clostridia bacterium]